MDSRSITQHTFLVEILSYLLVKRRNSCYSFVNIDNSSYLWISSNFLSFSGIFLCDSRELGKNPLNRIFFCNLIGGANYFFLRSLWFPGFRWMRCQASAVLLMTTDDMAMGLLLSKFKLVEKMASSLFKLFFTCIIWFLSWQTYFQ